MSDQGDLFAVERAPEPEQPSRTMPALSLWQPWASLIVSGAKWHETRHWPTRVRGQFAVHAAKKLDVDGAPDQLCRFLWGSDWQRNLPSGAVVAIADLTACESTDDIEARVEHIDLEAGNFGPGRFAFRLSDVRALRDPIPLIGRQGFFSWNIPSNLEELLGEVVDQLGPALRYERALAR